MWFSLVKTLNTINLGFLYVICTGSIYWERVTIAFFQNSDYLVNGGGICLVFVLIDHKVYIKEVLESMMVFGVLLAVTCYHKLITPCLQDFPYYADLRGFFIVLS